MDKIKLKFNTFKLIIDRNKSSDFVNELFNLCEKYSNASDIEYAYEYKKHAPEINGPQVL
jgi:hypothetical protein